MIQVVNCPILDSRHEHLAKLVSMTYEKKVTKTAEIFTKSPPKVAGGYSVFSNNLAVLALYEAVINNDLFKSKSLFYLSALSQLKACMDSQAINMFYKTHIQVAFQSIFSDAVHLIPAFSKIRHKDEESLNGKPSWVSYGLGRLYQAGLVKDWDTIKHFCLLFKDKGWLEKEPWLKQRLDFYGALCEQNAFKVESTLADILSVESVIKLNKEFKHLPLGKFMCAPGMWFAKLAWICGYQIEIDHPLIISELLPVKPLDYYDNPYEFLEDPIF
ncbi:MAG: hypothetical protein ACMZ64_10955 [Oleiphilus sp.]